MPYRRKYTKKGRRSRRRRKQSKQRNMTKYGVPSGMPVQRRAYLRYTDLVEVNSSTGVLTGHIFRANSVYDPDQSAVGHQPMGFDQWAALFRHYVVVGSKISISVMNDDGSVTQDVPLTCGVYLSDNNALEYTSANGYIEAKRGTYRHIQHYKQARMGTKFSARKFFNVTDIKDNEARLGASVLTNPTEEAFYVLWLQAVGGGTGALSFRVVIDYIVDFSEPKTIAQS